MEKENQPKKSDNQYLTEFHKQSSEAAQKEIAKLADRSFSWEEMKAQTGLKNQGRKGRD